MNEILIETIQFNNYVLPDLKASRTGDIILNGDCNSFYTYVQECFNGSPTNNAIIKSMSKLICGMGLVDKTGLNISKYISKTDVKLICADFKKFGSFSLQVIYSQGSKLLDEPAKPIRFKYIPIFKLGLNVEKSSGDINGYWYSFDWVEKSKNKPKFYKKFDGVYDANAPIQIFVCNQTSSNDYFPNPDYLPGLQYCQLEEELSNSNISHVRNAFVAGKLINVKGAIPPTEELREVYTQKIKKKLTGSTHKNEPIIAFYDGFEGTEISIENIEVTGLDAQLVYFSEEATSKLLMAHSITSPSLLGIPSPAGFSSQAEDRIAAMNQLYVQTINPYREEIIDGLEYLLSFCEPTYQLEFQNFDFEETTVEEAKNNEVKNEQ